VWLLALALAAGVVWRTPFLTDMSVFLPQRPSAEQRLLAQSLTEGVASRLLLVGIDSVVPERQAEFSVLLAKNLRSNAQFGSVNNGALDGLKAEQALLFEHRYQLSPAITPEQFEVPKLRLALQETVDLLSSSAGAFAGELALRDPTGETLRIVEAFSVGQAPRLHDGVWVSADRKRIMLLVYTAAQGGDLDGQQAALNSINQAFAAVQQATGLSAARLQVSGPGRFAVESRRTIQEDVTRLSLIGTALVFGLLWLAFRSPWAIALALVPIVSAVAAGAACVALVFGSIHGLTIGFGTTLIGESVDYALYHLVRTASRQPVPQRAFWRTIRLGVMTSVVGFGALLFTGFPGLAQLAVFSIAGIIVAAVVTQAVLPSLTPRQFKPRDLAGLDGRIMRALQLWYGWRRPVTVALLLVAGLTLLAAGTRKQSFWDADIAALNPISTAAQALHEELQNELGAPAADLMVIVSAATLQQVLAAAEAVGVALETLVRNQQLGSYESPSKLLPPEFLQRQRMAALPDAVQLQARLKQAADGLPIKLDRLQEFVNDVERARTAAPLTRADLVNTQLGVRVESQLAGRPPQLAAIITLRPVAGQSIDAALLARTMATLSDRQLSGAQVSLLALKAETDKLYGGYLREAAWLSLGGALAIVALLVLVLRSLSSVAIVCAPLFGAVVLVIAAFAGFGKSMNLLHLIGLLLVVAIGSNYALFLHSLRDGALAGTPSSGTLASLVLANLTTMAGFSVLAVSKVPLLSALGTTVGAGCALALVLSGLWIGPGGKDVSSIAHS
jgi:predicted exporter